jgi:hypothetical protein
MEKPEAINWQQFKETLLAHPHSAQSPLSRHGNL